MAVGTAGEWTQDQSIAFEAARECLSDMIAIVSGEIAAAEQQHPRDEAALAKLIARQAALALEREDLRLTDDEGVFRVRSEYGPIVRAHRARR
jgi:hypothetical protein